jgi:hypothetical protein
MLLLAIQFGVAAAGAAVLHLFPFDTGSSSWVSGVGVVVGAQTFAMQKERKQPGVMSRPYVKRLAAYAALGQLLAGALFIALFTPDLIAALAGGLTTRVLIAIGVGGLGLALAYGLSLFGLKQGLKVAQNRVQKRAPLARDEAGTELRRPTSER